MYLPILTFSNSNIFRKNWAIIAFFSIPYVKITRFFSCPIRQTFYNVRHSLTS